MDPGELLDRHQWGDWGDLGPEDRKMNDRDLRKGGQLFSAYELDGAHSSHVWNITEADRRVTTILLPKEY